MRLVFRAQASRDLQRIAQETRAAWGDDQAKRYVAKLRADIKSLRDFPMRYPQFEPQPILRRMNSGRHAVFYKVGEEQVEVVRILHTARDLKEWV